MWSGQKLSSLWPAHVATMAAVGTACRVQRRTLRLLGPWRVVERRHKAAHLRVLNQLRFHLLVSTSAWLIDWLIDWLVWFDLVWFDLIWFDWLIWLIDLIDWLIWFDWLDLFDWWIDWLIDWLAVEVGGWSYSSIFQVQCFLIRDSHDRMLPKTITNQPSVADKTGLNHGRWLQLANGERPIASCFKKLTRTTTDTRRIAKRNKHGEEKHWNPFGAGYEVVVTTTSRRAIIQESLTLKTHRETICSLCLKVAPLSTQHHHPTSGPRILGHCRSQGAFAREIEGLIHCRFRFLGRDYWMSYWV